MNNENMYVLTRRNLYYFADQICERGEKPVKTGILTGIIQDLDPNHHREVLRAIIKAVYSTDDETAAGRLSRALVKGIDYILDLERPRVDIPK